eukprot:TRINITY_DN15706_c0_g1_i1.p1 TRINITY_DN15706_c0_g1~~TRINITY_DN15706_c0_g1_i1.p1  ORF type:complete len:284 (-),score=86.96 TRINITY_DN15706_c0_g1_i1:67-837(-)
MSQYAQQKSASAKILKEQRFNAGDGRFGSAYAQEDGTVFREETSAGGERIGQYSYVDNDGKTITVKYSAGVDGFKILEGAHVPTGANGQNSAVHDANYREPAPAPVQQAAPAYNYNNNVQANNYVQPTQAPNPNRNPFINPNDPTHTNFQYNTNAANYAPGNSYSQQVQSVPNCADCAGTNPFINPYDPSHQRGYVHPQQAAPVQQAQPAQNQYNYNTQQNNNNYAYTTQAPRNFFPPGKLSLNRFETGFNFDFES